MKANICVSRGYEKHRVFVRLLKGVIESGTRFRVPEVGENRILRDGDAR